MRLQRTTIVSECVVTSVALILVYLILFETNTLHHAKTTVFDMYDYHISISGRKQFIILLAGSRTGSTFLGELFNQNPHMLYIFEPFNVKHLLDLREYGAIPESDERSTLDELQLFWLRQVLDRCDTGDLVIHPEQEQFGKCGVDRENVARFGSKTCNETFTTTPRSELCIYRNSVVLKINRLLQLSSLSQIEEAMLENDMKVIHLIRDPRDVIQSRFKFKHYYYKDRFPVTHSINVDNKVGLAAEEWCTRQLDDLLYAERNPPAWLNKNNYKLMTFDDLIRDPASAAAELYKFIGYNGVPDSVTSWIRKHGNEKLDLMANDVDDKTQWNSNYTRVVEEECKPLIIKMGLQFQELKIKYTQSYY